jgi:hypothetical protein
LIDLLSATFVVRALNAMAAHEPFDRSHCDGMSRLGQASWLANVVAHHAFAVMPAIVPASEYLW